MIVVTTFAIHDSSSMENQPASFYFTQEGVVHRCVSAIVHLKRTGHKRGFSSTVRAVGPQAHNVYVCAIQILAVSTNVSLQHYVPKSPDFKPKSLKPKLKTTNWKLNLKLNP